jgi:hypothetical protein
VSLDVEIGHHLQSSERSYSRFRHGERVEASERYFLRKCSLDEVVEGRKFDDGWDRNSGFAVGGPKPPPGSVER